MAASDDEEQPARHESAVPARHRRAWIGAVRVSPLLFTNAGARCVRCRAAKRPLLVRFEHLTLVTRRPLPAGCGRLVERRFGQSLASNPVATDDQHGGPDCLKFGSPRGLQRGSSLWDTRFAVVREQQVHEETTAVTPPARCRSRWSRSRCVSSDRWATATRAECSRAARPHGTRRRHGAPRIKRRSAPLRRPLRRPRRHSASVFLQVAASGGRLVELRWI
jgi:hypothetical protein